MTNANTAQLFDGLCRAVRAEPDRRGWVHIPCLECGKEKRHFGFSERGAHCFSCGFNASLKVLAERLNAQPVPTASVLRHVEPPKDRKWHLNPQRWLDDYCSALDRVQCWQKYKPLSLDTISRYKLGVGRLPSSQCQHRRLVYPLILDGRIVGFRGRSITCDCPKWLTCGGSQTICVNLDLVKRGSQVIIVENPVDAALAMQETPDVIVIASTAGAGTWRDEWTQTLAERRPEHVIVWLDHDLAGNGSPHHWHEMIREWRAKHPEATHTPQPNGPKLVKRFLDARIPTSLYQWSKGTAWKQDIGTYLIERMEVVA